MSDTWQEVTGLRKHRNLASARRQIVFRAQFWSAEEVADVSQKNVGVDEPGSLT